MRGWRIRRFELAVIATIVALDQASKAAVRMTLDLHESVTIIPGLLDFTHVRNTGAAFGVLNTVDFPFKPVVMAGVAALALVVIAAFALRVPPEERLGRLGLALVLGGATGNLIDRVAAGYVVDFVDFYWRGWHFWAFNVADAAITLGAAALVIEMFGLGRHASRSL